LARANADIATVPTHVRVLTISLERSTQNLQLSTSWAGRLPHLLGAKRTVVQLSVSISSWLSHSIGNCFSRSSSSRVAGCRPSRMASMMVGESRVRRRMRDEFQNDARISAINLDLASKAGVISDKRLYGTPLDVVSGAAVPVRNLARGWSQRRDSCNLVNPWSTSQVAYPTRLGTAASSYPVRAAPAVSPRGLLRRS
jgi:hypothetical protein